MKKKTIQQQEIFLLVYDPVSRCTTFTRIYTLTTANELQNDTVQTFYLPTNRYIFKDETANQIQSSRQINDAETEKDIHLPPSRPIDDAALSLYNPQNGTMTYLNNLISLDLNPRNAGMKVHP
jgi:hypothetical protein